MKRLIPLLVIFLFITGCGSNTPETSRLENPQDLQKPEAVVIYVSPTVTADGDQNTPEPTQAVQPTAPPAESTAPPETSPTDTAETDNLPTITISPSATVTATETPPGDCPVEFDRNLNLALLSQINAERAVRGLDNIQLSNEMRAAAEKHAADLICSNIIGHIGSDGSTPEDRADQMGIAYGELKEFVLLEAESSTAIAALLTDPEFKQVLQKSDYKSVGLAFVDEYYAGKKGVFVLVFFT